MHEALGATAETRRGSPWPLSGAIALCWREDVFAMSSWSCLHATNPAGHAVVAYCPSHVLLRRLSSLILSGCKRSPDDTFPSGSLLLPWLFKSAATPPPLPSPPFCNCISFFLSSFLLSLNLQVVGTGNALVIPLTLVELVQHHLQHARHGESDNLQPALGWEAQHPSIGQVTFPIFVTLASTVTSSFARAKWT